MTFETRKRLAQHFYNLGKKNHIYVLEMKKNKGDNLKTKKIKEEEIPEIQKDEEVKVEKIEIKTEEKNG